MQIKYSSYLRHASEPYTSEAGKKILSSGPVVSGNSAGNQFHDPKNGQFTFSPNKASKVASVANMIGKTNSRAAQAIDTSPIRGERMDLSNMTNKELNEAINRERLEQEYNRYFNTPQENKGAQFAKAALEYSAMAASVAVAGFTIYSIVKS